MYKALRGARLRRTGCISNGSPRSKRINHPSLMARKLQLHARLHRLCGCFFICGLFGGAKRAPARVVWKSWYTLYSCALMVLVIWLDMEVIVAKAITFAYHSDHVHNTVMLVAHCVLLFRMIVSFLFATLKSSKLLAFQMRTSSFERHIGVTCFDSTTARLLFWSNVREASLSFVYCVGYTLTLTKLPPYKSLADPEDSPLKQAKYWLKILMTVIFYYVYDSVCIVNLRCACEVLAVYLRKQLYLLKVHINRSHVGSAHSTSTARLVESVRLNVATIRRLKEEINDIWGFPLILSSFCVLLVVCAGVYEVCRKGVSITEQSSLVVYTLWLSYYFVKLASASQSLINAAKDIKNFCQGVGGINDTYFWHQIEDLHDSIQPEDMCLKGGNFFNLNMPLLVSMSGAVITYTVILVQTNQSFYKSLNETSAVHNIL